MAIEVQVEAKLYEPTRLFVGAHLRQQLRERSPSGRLQLFVEDTSTAGGNDSGYWSKPDVSALAVSRGEFVPYWKADLHTFEVKTAAGLSESSVHEANAHGRFGQYSWLVFQAIGKCAPETAAYKRVVKLAAQLGVGVIHFADASSPKYWIIEHWARLTGANAASADSFVRERFTPTIKTRISSHLSTLGWPGLANDD
ncbi:hypothetical protein [Vitreimonas sp.]|uniref:hypothetical protein n=1 Tax=Vitreimonas sp. TaxID=3069702 RepID=UPI002ED783F7